MTSSTARFSHSGLTMMQAPYATLSDLGSGDIAVAGVPFDTTVSSRPGSPRYAPREIRQHSAPFVQHLISVDQGQLINVDTGETISTPMRPVLKDLGDLSVYPVDVAKTFTAIADGVYEIVQRKAIPLILGGDHYISYPSVVGYARARREAGARKFGYIQIDAHLDACDDNPTWGKHYHGSMARRISEQDGISVSSMVWLGLMRHVAREQFDWIKRSGGTLVTREEMRRDGIEKAASRAVEAASSGVDGVYLTIDVDVVDFAYSPGTGSYNFGGLTSAEFLELIRCLREYSFDALDICAVAPSLDASGVTARLAATALIDFLTPRLFDMGTAT